MERLQLAQAHPGRLISGPPRWLALVRPRRGEENHEAPGQRAEVRQPLPGRTRAREGTHPAGAGLPARRAGQFHQRFRLRQQRQIRAVQESTARLRPDFFRRQSRLPRKGQWCLSGRCIFIPKGLRLWEHQRVYAP